MIHALQSALHLLQQQENTHKFHAPQFVPDMSRSCPRPLSAIMSISKWLI